MKEANGGASLKEVGCWLLGVDTHGIRSLQISISIRSHIYKVELETRKIAIDRFVADGGELFNADELSGET